MGLVLFFTVYTIFRSETADFFSGWDVPPLWTGIWVLITIQWVQIALKKEKEAWQKNSNTV